MLQLKSGLPKYLHVNDKDNLLGKSNVSTNGSARITPTSAVSATVRRAELFKDNLKASQEAESMLSSISLNSHLQLFLEQDKQKLQKYLSLTNLGLQMQ